ncbi:MAG: hypothetical protein ABIE07_11990 [Candidatus Zixiibacteriota bacterium]
MKKCLVYLIAVFGMSIFCGTVMAKSYPRDARFKELSFHKDKWYFIDHKNWYIKAPDKWTHFMGSRAVAEVTAAAINDKTWGSVIALGFGLLKEVDDGYREGWSKRDIYMDVGGITSFLLMPEKIEFLAYYDNSAIMFKMSFIID